MMIFPRAVFDGFTVLFSCEPIIYTLSIIGFAFVVFTIKTIIE